jgi:hypothetical protein
MNDSTTEDLRVFGGFYIGGNMGDKGKALYVGCQDALNKVKRRQ